MLYLARSTDPVLRKKFWREDNDQLAQQVYPGSTFTYERREASTLRDVFELLSALADDPYRAIVMGRPTIERGERNALVFEELPTDFWFIDLDGVPVTGTVTETIERCLSFLHGCAYVYAFTQSAGLKDGLRVRVVCRVAKKHPSSMFEAYARHYNDLLTAFEGKKASYIDTKIYAPSRLLFTSRPELVGIADQHPERVFYVDGDEVVTLDTLPDMTEIATGIGMTFETLPTLQGTWGHGDGYDRSRRALNAIGWLRGYMGEDDWSEFEKIDGEDVYTKRTELWHEMLRRAGAGDEDFQKYGNFVNDRAKDARVPSAEQRVSVIANKDTSLPLAAASERLESLIRRIVSDVTPGVYGINVTMGTGKTHLAFKHLAVQSRYIEQNPLADFYIDYYVPTYSMAEEALATAQSHGLRGFIERGRKQEGMCIKADSADKLQGLVDNVAEHICKRDGATCEHFHSCRWQWQRTQTGAIPLRIRVHDYLPLVMRTEQHEAYRPINFVVIDETSWVSDLTHHAWIELSDVLEPRHDQYKQVLKFAEVIYEGLTIERLEAAGFTPDVFRDLIKAEESLRPVLDVSPDMSPSETWDAVEGFNDRWHEFASLWRRMRDCLEHRSLNRIRVIKGDRVSFSLNWKSDIASIPWDNEAGRPAVPVLVMSGTMRREIIEQFLPFDEYHEIDVAPHEGATITQSDMRGTKAECLYGSSEQRVENGEDDTDKIKAAAEVRDKIVDIADGKVLITYKELEGVIGREGTAHFNAIEGLNEFSGRDLVVYGRPLPEPRRIEDLTRAIFCDDPEPVRSIKGFWYPSRRVARRGPGFSYAEYHPDARVESVRWMVCEGEIMQALARSRYVREPVDVLILTRTPLPLRIHQFVSSKKLDPQWREFEESRVLPLTQREYVRLWPKVWSDHRSADRWARANVHRWADEKAAFEIRYRVKGARGPAKKALVDGAHAIRTLGVESWEMVDSDHNDWAVHQRELADMLAREPSVLEDGAEAGSVVEGDMVAVETRSQKAQLVAKRGQRGLFEWERKN